MTAAPAKREPLLTVSALTAMVKNAIADGLPGTVHVVGQISNFKRHSSGHLYFTLKDDSSELGAVMWRSAAAKLAFKPDDGMEVTAVGYVDVFERAGRYQLYVRKLEPRGIGALELAFRQLRDKLSAEGLFDPAQKKPLPKYPQRIAVVTSPTGAAVRDILQTLERRYPCADVLLYPVAVQGPAAAGQVASAIEDLNRRRGELGGIDVLIVGRGGGSLEDLWAFNEEVVARAIYASTIPVVSAVGHEVDITISDLVADVRAATPTAAAELVAPDRAEVLALVDRHRERLSRCIQHGLELGRLRLESATRRRPFAEPADMVRRRELVIDEFASRSLRLVQQRTHNLHGRLRRAETVLQRIQPHAYALRVERRLGEALSRLRAATSQKIRRSEQRLTATLASLSAVSPGLQVPRSIDRLNHCERRLSELIARRHERLHDRLEADAVRLSCLSHRSTLARGFSVTRTKKGRRVVRDPARLADGDRILTETAAGEFESRVVNRKQLELFE